MGGGGGYNFVYGAKESTTAVHETYNHKILRKYYVTIYFPNKTENVGK
jgi:hypothetical protein